MAVSSLSHRNAEWMLRSGDTEACTQVKKIQITCSKDWNKDKNRFRTHFVVTDSN